MSAALLPCPFCGGGAFINGGGLGLPFGACMNEHECGAALIGCDTEAEAIAAWNRRPAPAWTQEPITEPGLYAYHTGKLIGWLEVEKDHNDGNLYSLRVFDTTARPMAEMNEAFTRDGWHRLGPLDLGRPPEGTT